MKQDHHWEIVVAKHACCEDRIRVLGHGVLKTTSVFFDMTWENAKNAEESQGMSFVTMQPCRDKRESKDNVQKLAEPLVTEEVNASKPWAEWSMRQLN